MAALGGLIAAAPLVGAQSSTPDTSPHLLLVPDTPRADAALDASSARTVASYDAFTLVEARGEDDADLRAAGADRRDDMRRVSLPGGDLDPLRGRDSLAAKGSAEPDEALAVVQFAGPGQGRLARAPARLRRADRPVRAPERLRRARERGGGGPASGPRRNRSGGASGHARLGRRQAGRGVPAGGRRSARCGSDADRRGRRGRARRVAAAGRPVRAATRTSAALTTQFVELERRRASRRSPPIPRSCRSRPTRCRSLLDERSAQIVAGNLHGGDADGAGRVPDVARHRRDSARRRSASQST